MTKNSNQTNENIEFSIFVIHVNILIPSYIRKLIMNLPLSLYNIKAITFLLWFGYDLDVFPKS